MRSLVGTLLLVAPLTLACGGGGGGSEAVELAYSNWKIEWVSDGSVREFDFLGNGTFVDPAHPKNKNSWKIDGDKIHMEYNDSFVVYDGEIVNDHTMGGTFTTKKGLEGPWRGRRLILD